MADDGWFARLKEAIEADGRAPRTISLAAQLGQNYIQQMLAKDTPPKLETLNKLLDALGPDAARRVRGQQLPASEIREADVRAPTRMVRDVPVYGTVAGSDYGRGAFQLTPDPVDYVRRPPGLVATRDIYALYVEGSSMEPRFESGELIFVNPNRPARPGDYVVIQEPMPDNTVRGFVKLFVKRTADWIIVRQFNPEAEMRFPGGEAVLVHRVLTTADMMGV